MKCSRIVSSILVMALMFNLFAAAAFAKTSRKAIITSVSGDVTITKGGGSNPIPAYVDMPLNQGDSITTGEDGNVTISIADPESERTIGANSDITISELTENADGKKSGFKVWVGSMWNKVKTLASGDEDGVDTPTATMGVRGTRYLVIANPDGTLSVVVASGLVAAKLTGNQAPGGDSGTSTTNSTGTNPPAGKNTVLLAPTQQINLNPAAATTDLTNSVSIVDVSSIVKQADPSIIKAFIIDASSIAQENKELVDNLKSALQQGKSTILQRGDAVSDLSIKNLDDLNKVSGNMNGLVGNIAKTAIQLNKVNSDELSKLIDEANKNITNNEQKVDLNAKPIDKNAGVDPADAKKKQDDQDRINQLLQQQALDRQRQQDALLQQLKDVLNGALEQQKKIDDANQKAKVDLAKQTEDQYVSTLPDDVKKDYDKNKEQNNNPTSSTPTTTQQQDSSSSSSSKPDMPSAIHADDISLSVSGKGPAGVNIVVEQLVGTAYVSWIKGTVGSDGSFNISVTEPLPAGTKIRAYTQNSNSSSDYLTATVGLVAPVVNAAMTTPTEITGKVGIGSAVQVFQGTSTVALPVAFTRLPTGIFTVTLGSEVYDQDLSVKVTSGDGTIANFTVHAPTKPVVLPSVGFEAVNQSGTGFDLQVKLNGFNASNVYAAELHILSGDYTAGPTASLTGTVTRNAKFTSTNSVDMSKTIFGNVDSALKAETIYAVTNFNTASTLSFADNDVLVTIHFNRPSTASGTYTFTLPYVLFVDNTGTPITTASTSGQTLTVTY